MKFSAVPYHATYRIVASVSWYVSYHDFAGDTQHKCLLYILSNNYTPFLFQVCVYSEELGSCELAAQK